MGAVLATSIIVLFAAILVLGSAVAVGRGLHRWRTARRTRRIAPVRPLLMQLAADDEDAVFALGRLSMLDPRLWRAIEPTAVGLLVKVKGAGRDSLVELFAQRGTVARALRDVRRRGAVRRARAAETLGLLEAQEAFPDLCDLLQDRVPQVRLVAARALGRLRDPRAAEPLLHSLVGGRNPASTVAKALVRIGPQVAPALGAGLEHGDPLVRSTAAQVLGLIGPTPEADRLIPLLADEPNPQVRTTVVQALGRLGTRVAQDALRRAAGPDSPSALRADIAAALGEIGAVTAVPELREMVGDPFYRVAHEAAAALARLGVRGEEELVAIAAGENALAAAHAEEALAEIRLLRDRAAVRKARLGGVPT